MNTFKHPEQREGEIYLTNGDMESFKAIDWKTKRLGNQAYDLDGNPYKGAFPIFVGRAEWEEYQKELKAKYRRSGE